MEIFVIRIGQVTPEVQYIRYLRRLPRLRFQTTYQVQGTVLIAVKLLETLPVTLLLKISLFQPMETMVELYSWKMKHIGLPHYN